MKLSFIIIAAAQYDALLTRYALYITKDIKVSGSIVVQVFEQYYDSNIPLGGRELRSWLQARTRKAAQEWCRRQAAPYFSQPLNLN